MQKHLENQKNKIEELKQKMRRAHNYAIKTQSLYEEQCKKNDDFVKQWDSRFNNQQKRIDTIIKIAKAEWEALFDDIESLIRDNSRFTVESLMVYSPYEWLNKHNQTIVKFIEMLIQNNREIDDLSHEKLFKIVIAVDAIYGTRHEKYVSEIHLAASAVKYFIAQLKKIISINNHIISFGSYY